MKVAICFSGQPRCIVSSYEKCILPNLIIPNENHNIDFFMHTWFGLEDTKKQYVSGTNRPITEIVEKKVLSNIYECYNPIKCSIERQIEFQAQDYYSRKAPFTNPEFARSKFYSIWKSGELKRQYEVENNFKYDIVIATRTDFCPEEKIDISSFDIESKFYGPHDCPHPKSIADVFNISNSDIMDIFSKLYFYVDFYWRVDNILFNQEQLLFHHMRTNNIEVLPFKLQYYLNRG